MREKAEQARLAASLWTSRADEFYEKYENQWAAVRHGEVVHHEPDEDRFLKWLERADPDRTRFMLEGAAEFAFV